MEDVWKKLGSAVRDGRLRYISVSQMEAFDPEVYGGCNRRWWFRRVAKSKEEQTKPSELGEKIHSQIEHYLRNGNKNVLGEIAKSGLRFLPRPGKGLRLEWIFGIPNGDVIESPLVLAGVPLIGKADCAHGRGEWVDDDGILHEDPDTCEVVDWKSTVRIHDEKDREGVVIREGLAKSADQLAAMHQMRAYAALATLEWPWKKRVVLAHGYFKTSWPLDALKRIKIVDTAGAEARFKADEPLVEKMKYTASVKDVRDIEPNLKACGAYRGCPHRDQCPRSPEGILANLFNIKRAPAREEKKTMGLMEKRKLEKAALAAGAPTSEVIAPTLEVAAEVEKLKAEESGIGAPDSPPPTDIAKAPETVTTFGGTADEPCAMGGQQAKMLDGSKSYSCGCGAIVRVRPKELADGFYALVPSHLVGEVVVKPAKAKKEKAEPTVVESGRTGYEDAPVNNPPREGETQSKVGIIHLALYLDCAPDHRFPVQRLEDLADEIATELARLSDAVDIRCAPEKSPLAFGKWKGALAAAIRENKPERGLWAVSSTSELGMVAFDALLPLANMVVRGAK